MDGGGRDGVLVVPARGRQTRTTRACMSITGVWGCDRVGVPDLSVSGDNFDLVEDDPHDPTMTSESKVPMQSLNQLPVVTDLVDARSA
jgi:hypothetical protein